MIELAALDVEIEKPDWQRTEYGSFESEIVGLTRWNGKPALEVFERLSNKRVIAVLSDALADELGPTHQWHEVWEGKYARLNGALHYTSDGDLKRADIDAIEDINWCDVPIEEVKTVNILEGKTVREHLRAVRGDA